MLLFLALDIYSQNFFGTLCPPLSDHLLIRTRGPSSGNFNLTVCGNVPPEKRMYPADVIFFRFFSNWAALRGTGFKLLYSFHSLGQMLQRSADGKWNCSVASWASMRVHFSCNLVVECAGGEDEQDCPYSSPLCEPGQFFLGHSCYTYMQAGEKSWDSASAQCQVSGSQLVSLNDMDEWRTVTRLLRQHGVLRVFTGLRSVSPALPLM